MSDKKPVPLAVAEQAARIVEIEGVLQLQSLTVKVAVENMSNTLASVQSDVRKSVEEIHKLALAHATSEADRQAIGRLEANFGELNKRLEEWFDDREKLDEQRWQAHDRTTEEYRLRHEAENENNFQEVNIRLNAHERKMTLWQGAIIGFSLLAATIVGGFLWTLNSRFEANNAAITDLTSKAEANRVRFETLKDKQHEIELWMARNGFRPAQQQEAPK